MDGQDENAVLESGMRARGTCEMTKIEIVPTPRAAMGWPCFHCGSTLHKCEEEQKKNDRRCCPRCKGEASH